MTTTQSTATVTRRSVSDWEHTLQINIGVLVILGTTLLAMGQQNLAYAIVAIAATVTALIVTDVKQRFYLGPDATTLAALGACVILVVQVIRNVEESQLLNVANILIYLEVILLFQKKQDRTYWSLMALSLLQVVVAAALNLGLVFGILLAVYILAAGTALMLFYAVREVRPFVQPDVAPVPASDRDTALPAFVGTLDVVDGARMINRPLLRRLGRMILITILATVVVFFAIPRFNRSTWQAARQDQITTVGFTEEVHLDDIGRILESPEEVMRVEFTDLQGRPYLIDGEPFFRGTVLPIYRFGGVWKQDRHAEMGRQLRTQQSFDLASTVLQRITLKPGSHSVLFNVSPCHYVDGSRRDLKVNQYTRQLTLDEDSDDHRGSLRYTLGTTAFRNGWQRDMSPALDPDTRRRVEWTKDNERSWVRDRLPAVAELSDSIITAGDLQEASLFDRAKAMENHFRRSGIYSYSLDVNKRRTRRLDPIEDFIQNHRTGHCEYFAGALTLMLRSQGVPARMVVGYRGGDYNTLGNYYIVRQLHAHAWVEAYLPLDEIPIDERDTAEPLEYGCWLRLDPTPDTVAVADDRQRLAIVTTIREFVDYCEVLWDDYVLGLNSMRQQQAIYRPIRRSLQMVGAMLFGRTAWSDRVEFMQNLLQMLTVRRILGIPAWLLVSLVAAAVLTVTIRWRHRLWSLARTVLSRLRSRSRTKRSDRPQLAVYRRFESALRQLNLVRAPNQTPLEFAARVRHELSGVPFGPAAAGVPERVTEAFYRFRYGNQSLSQEENEQLLESVRQLELALGSAQSISNRPS